MIDPIIYSLLVATAIGLAAGYLGSIMVLEKMALVGDALSHVALPGLAIGILFNFNPFFGAFIFLFASAIIIWHIQRFTKLSFDTLVGSTFTLALAVGVLLVPAPELLEALFGDISKIEAIDAVLAIIIAIIAIVLTRFIYKKIVLSLISEELAVSTGINVEWINLLYLLLVSLVVAMGIRITGTLLVGYLVVTPAAAAKTISSNLYRYMVLSSIFGAVSAFSGVLISNYFILPPGPLVVLSGIVLFGAVLLIRWRLKLQ